ncbi:MAG: hypothetical protein OXG81_08010 [Acidobacteria bacterium]|nr:hypothetical protein [Acidobacteriota bacterium]
MNGDPPRRHMLRYGPDVVRRASVRQVVDAVHGRSVRNASTSLTVPFRRDDARNRSAMAPGPVKWIRTSAQIDSLGAVDPEIYVLHVQAVVDDGDLHAGSGMVRAPGPPDVNRVRLPQVPLTREERVLYPGRHSVVARRR